MKKIIGALVLGISVLLGNVSSEAVAPSKIVGLVSACDTTDVDCQPIPLTVTVLCTVSCPLRVSPSYNSSTEFWAAIGSGTGACVRSVDGGLTWPACTTQPFTTGANELYAGAADGSVIAFGTTTGPNTCTARRSTDNGTSWTTTFTQVANCNSGGLEGQRIICLSSGTCNVVVSAGGVANAYLTTDNGQSWFAGIAGIAPNCSMTTIAWDGSFGIAPSQAPGCGGGGVARARTAVGSVWADSATWDGTQGDCWGAVMYNNTSNAVCQGAGATPDGRYTIRNSVGTLVMSVDLPGAFIIGIDAGGVAVAPFTNTMYMFATRTTDTGIWVSRDALSTFALIGTLTGTMRGGHAFFANGCVYAVVGTLVKFVQIC